MKYYSVLMSCHRLKLAHLAASGEFGTFQRHRRSNPLISGIHCHDFHELFWVDKGPGIHWINGSAQEIRPGMLQLIQPDDEHTFAAIPGVDFEWTNVAFYSSSWRFFRQRYFSGKVRYFDLRDWKKRVFTLSKEELSELRVAASALNRGARDRLAFEQFLLNALSLLPGPTISRSAPPGWLLELRQELGQQINFGRGVTAVVQTAGRCPEHVCREFRRYFDCTPTETMARARMDFAARLLSETEVKIVDLALEIGLPNLGHFYRSFSRHFNCTPRQYRLRHSRNRSAFSSVAES